MKWQKRRTHARYPTHPTAQTPAETLLGKTQLNKPNQRRTKKNKKSEEESKNMRAAKTDKFGFHQNPSFSKIGVSDLYTSKQFSGSEIAVYRRHRPQKKQDNRSKRQARLGRDKYQSSPGPPFFLRVSQLSERESSRCVRRIQPQKWGSSHRETGSHRCFF